MSNSNIRILVIDDHPLFRAGVIHVLQSAPGIEVIGEANGLEDAFAIMKRTVPDVVLLDIGIKGGGLSAATAISQNFPSTKLVMLTVSENEDDVSGAMQAG